jgi:hypothetical protein
MAFQKRLIDGIHSFSPKREKWVSKPIEDLPEKVTVSFKTGQTGFLDMKNPRAVYWANVIGRLKRANRPVYVEIDEDSKVITKVLIPIVYKVKALDPDDQGDIRVMLDPSAAIHLLLQSHPNFDTMRTKLQTAMDNHSELLIVETRDEHEIIDAITPPETAEGSPDPTPPPPDDPAVSEVRAQQFYDDMNALSCIPPFSPGSDCITFLYPDDGCHTRAHMMCMKIIAASYGYGGPIYPGKVWVQGIPSLTVETPNHPASRVAW